MLKNVDETLVTKQHKFLLYRPSICHRMSWNLIVNSLPMGDRNSGSDSHQIPEEMVRTSQVRRHR